MTRINSAIFPNNLTDQHLIAELRELPRIFTAVKKRIEQNKSFDDIPKEFCLGTGHTKFFYNKLKFLIDRYCFLKYEYYLRFKKSWQYPIDQKILTGWILNYLFYDYTTTQQEYQLLIDRISTRINESNQIPRYYGEKITKQQAIHLLRFGILQSEVVPQLIGSDLNIKQMKEKLELCNKILTWWEEHQFDVTGDCGEFNVYDEDPDFVIEAKRIIEKYK